MFKKSVSILFLVLASSLYLGHSFFPHTHVKEHHHNGEHHHHHDEGSDDNDLSLLFAHFNHSSEFFPNNHLEDVVKTSQQVPNTIALVEGISIFSNSIAYFSKKEVVQNKEPLVFISPHLHSLQFRGPPTLFI
jgi:hypothetical protein